MVLCGENGPLAPSVSTKPFLHTFILSSTSGHGSAGAEALWMSVAVQGGGEGGNSWFSPVLSHWHNHSSPVPGGWKLPASYKINAPFFSLSTSVRSHVWEMGFFL